MRVALLNLGEAPRIFHNRLNKPISCPVGKITIADLDARVVQGLKHPVTPETVLVGEEDMKIPDDIAKIIDLLAVVEFEGYELLLRRFLEVAPPNNLGPGMRPSRQQVRQMLRTMVEDWIAAYRENPKAKVIRDDKDPNELSELEKAEQRRQNPDPEHPLETERKRKLTGEGEVRAHEVPPIAVPAKRVIKTVSAGAGRAAPRDKKPKNKRRA